MTRISLHALLISSLAAVTTARNCKDLKIPLSLSAVNTDLAIKTPVSDIDVTNLVLSLVQPASAPVSNSTGNSSSSISGNYTIGATYCEPDGGPGSVLQVLTHGIAFDRSYWDFRSPHHNHSYNHNHSYSYSYVEAALARNYSTFAYDRLGLGASSRGDPVAEIQAALEVSSLHQLTRQLRAAQVPGVKARFDKVVHVGHSFGASQTFALTAAHPDGVSDGVALTGFSQGLQSFGAAFVFAGNFVQARKAGYAPGYLALGDAAALQTLFFAPGGFDPAVLDAAYRTAEPVTVGELVTIGGTALGNSSFGGPVLVITGGELQDLPYSLERDLPFCGGNCAATSPNIPAQVKQSYINASYFESKIVPGAGHGLNLEYSAESTYESILDFFDKSVRNQAENSS
ncbi:hypothetical protein M426DRAFT_71352 [Hypoxylon sp. CI-4A]|nr:hypothetical protein M426DRAFT_71352 [Hypoxylon sp. CI-4A]